MSNDANVSKRDGFRSRGGFIIACIGSAVGMGNIWRFPTLVSKWGGMTFLLPYFLFVILIGSTGVIGEFALGRAAGAGPVDAFGMCTETRWGKRRPGELVGYIPVLGSLALAIGYTCVMGWIFKYTFLAFDGGLSATGQDMDGIVATFNATASAWGANVWVVVAVAVSFVIMSFGIAGGIEKANKIMMPILFLLFVGLGIYVGTLPGASDGYRYIFTIKPAGLLDPYVWIYAFGQAFFSLSVAGNGSVIYGSYLSKSECIPSSARNVALFDTIAALLAALEDCQAELVVLAGFLSILGEAVIARYRNRILNVHPSLIPAFCGKGFYGLKVHQAALEYGVKVTGATVHFVNEIPDGGAIILQKAVEILPDDTPETLQRRVMEQAEWVILPEAIDRIANGRIE